ncbi:MAG TPA: hypothetical protein DCP92_19900 [Nitrospiraceae bacterium]|nr:hypothetical protein [Nitrospiraceae bacterium]
MRAVMSSLFGKKTVQFCCKAFGRLCNRSEKIFAFTEMASKPVSVAIPSDIEILRILIYEYFIS